MQESQRLKEGFDPDKGGSSTKLESLISDLREDRSKVESVNNTFPLFTTFHVHASGIVLHDLSYAPF
jgi:hypothetical protein